MELFEKLKSKIPEDLLNGMLERDVISQQPYYEDWAATASARIPEVVLSDIFPAEMEQGKVELENFLGTWGNVSIESVVKLCLMVQYLKPRCIFEFGTFNGVTTQQLAINSKFTTQIWTLDLPPESEETRGTEVDTYLFRGVKERRYASHATGHKVHQLIGNSKTFNFWPYYGLMDFIFIDGGHDYDTKKADSENALKMLRPNGVIVWDNYKDAGAPQVTNYLAHLDLPLFHLKNTNMAVHIR